MMGAGSIGLTVFSLLPIAEALSVLPDFPIGKREMETRAEYYTEAGKYRGGNPRYSDEFQSYECTLFNSDSSGAAINSTTTATTDNSATSTTTDGSATSTTDGAEGGNATVCMSWTANKLGSDVNDVGRCSCQSVEQTAGYYCDAWTCTQLGAESARCTCQTEDPDSGQFCSSWTCLETDSDGTEEIAEYQCVTISSEFPVFCEAWTGEIEGSGEVEVASCACAEQLGGAGVCSVWECKERELVKCSRGGPSWCNLGVSVGVGGLFGSVGAMLFAFGLYALRNMDRLYLNCFLVACILFLGFFRTAIWYSSVVIWGGLDGAVYVGVWWGTIVGLSLLCRCLATHRDRIVPRYIAQIILYNASADQPVPN